MTDGSAPPRIVRRLVWRYAYAIASREWMRCQRIPPKRRLTVSAVIGAAIAPWVVFVLPVARIVWLLTGRRPPRPFDLLSPRPYALANPFRVVTPPDVQQLLDQPQYRWQPEPDDMPRWLEAWARLAQIISWDPPIGASSPPPR